MKLRSEQFAQAFDAAEVSFVNGASCFYFDTNVSATTLHDDVDFVAVLVSQVMERQAFCVLGADRWSAQLELTGQFAQVCEPSHLTGQLKG